MSTPPLPPPKEPDPAFAGPAPEDRIERARAGLERRRFRAVVCASREQAIRELMADLPDGARVFTATSRTLESIGALKALEETKRFDLLRPKILAMNRSTQSKEIRAIVQSTDVVVGSVHAITENGVVYVASATGSQLALYADPAVHVVWIVGAQKIVRTDDDARTRLERYSLPLEDARMRAAFGVPSALNKVLINFGEPRPGRVSVLLLTEAVGF